MNVHLIEYTQNPDRLCATAALGCRSEKDTSEIITRLSNEKVKSILRATIDRGHHSVIEHASFTFSVSEVSRALTHQLVRHRLASYSQQSQRHVRLDKPTFITPHSIKNNKEINTDYQQFISEIWKFYNKLISNGISEEDARFVLPNATTTNIMITMNARELMHFFELRCCITAQWEIREMADRMLKLVKKVAPVIFENAGPPCDRCPEPKIACPKRKQLSVHKL